MKERKNKTKDKNRRLSLIGEKINNKNFITGSITPEKQKFQKDRTEKRKKIHTSKFSQLEG